MGNVVDVRKRLIEVLVPFVDVQSQESNNNIGEDNRPVLIVLARKMTRLLEKYRKDDTELDNILVRCDIVTEHAIPTFIRKLYGSTRRIMILDDMIVYGVTAEIVSESVYYACGIMPEIQAICKTKFAKNFPFNSGREIIPEINDKEIPAFTTNNAHKILSLNSPIDLEHTIVVYEFDKMKTDEVRKHLLEVVSSVFQSEGVFVYQTIHKIDSEEFTSVTVCFNNTNAPHYTNNDFNKLRFFVSESKSKAKLQIVSYAPYMLFEDWLSSDSMLFKDTVFNDVWKYVCEEIEQTPNPIEFDKELSLMKGLAENEYNQRQKLSKVVWANYLSSFSNVLALKQDIINLVDHLSKECEFQEKKGMLDEKDLEYILGPELGKKMCGQLETIFDMSDDNVSLCPHAYYDKDLSRLSLIPEKYKTEYSSSNLVHTFYSKNLREALSLIFTNMHFNIGLANIELAANQQLAMAQFERLRFGESFDSLEYLLSSFAIQEDVRIELHKWIDERIDLGIVVPKYEQNMDSTGRLFWKRYFRAGENEDLYIKLARVCLYEINNTLRNSSTDSFTKNDFEKMIPNVIKKCNDHNLHISELFSDKSDGDIRIDNIWSYLCNIPVIVPLEDSYVINRSSKITKELLNGLPWPMSEK